MSGLPSFTYSSGISRIALSSPFSAWVFWNFPISTSFSLFMPEIFERIGVHLEVEGDDIRIDQKEIYEIENFIDGSTLTIADAPWPGLSPDLISIFLVVCTQAKGMSGNKR